MPFFKSMKEKASAIQNKMIVVQANNPIKFKALATLLAGGGIFAVKGGLFNTALSWGIQAIVDGGNNATNSFTQAYADNNCTNAITMSTNEIVGDCIGNLFNALLKTPETVFNLFRNAFPEDFNVPEGAAALACFALTAAHLIYWQWLNDRANDSKEHPYGKTLAFNINPLYASHAQQANPNAIVEHEVVGVNDEKRPLLNNV